MEREELLSLILDSWNTSITFADTNHIIQYMNLPAKKQYAKWGEIIGKSVFNCHTKHSAQMIKDIFLKLKAGAEEVIYLDSEKYRVYMRAVRDGEGNLIGYYERYEPPQLK